MLVDTSRLGDLLIHELHHLVPRNTRLTNISHLCSQYDSFCGKPAPVSTGVKLLFRQWPILCRQNFNLPIFNGDTGPFHTPQHCLLQSNSSMVLNLGSVLDSPLVRNCICPALLGLSDRPGSPLFHGRSCVNYTGTAHVQLQKL